MSNEESSNPADSDAIKSSQGAEVEPRNLTAGQMLRRAREASGLHVAAMAVALKVPVRKLEALESDTLNSSQDAVFVRALAGSVCRALKIDPSPILALLPSTTSPLGTLGTSSINRSFSSQSPHNKAGWVDQLSRPVLLGVLALILGALALMFLPDFLTKMDLRSAGDSVVNASPAQVSVATAAPPSGGETVLGAPRESGLAAAPPAASNQTTVAISNGVLPAGSATFTVQNSMVPAASATVTVAAQGFDYVGNGSDTVVFKAIKEVWVEVVDAKGLSRFKRTLTPGEVGGAGGALPLRVIIGRGDSVQVLVRGKPFDLAPHSKDNVARFEVK